MAKLGLLVDYQWCTGCHSCEVACQMEHGLPPDQFGIKISEVGPWQYGAKKWQYTYIPSLTDQCNFCASRTNKGKLPSCVQHCQANCIQLKDADEAVRSLAEKEKQLFMTVH